MSTINLTEISYPVFKIGTNKPNTEDGVVYFVSLYKDPESNETKYRYRIVDDKNIPEDTLARRRLRLKVDGVPLHKLSKAIFFLGDLIKLGTAKVWFIDSAGKIFQYEKSKTAQLLFKKITKVLFLKGGGALLELEGLPLRFKTLYAPKEYERWAGVLKDGKSYILYGVYDQKFDITRRMI